MESGNDDAGAGMEVTTPGPGEDEQQQQPDEVGIPDIPDVNTTYYRFAIGDGVKCKVSASRWLKGNIVALNYREDHWPQAMIAPYQIKLDDGRLIYCPNDSESLIRAVGNGDDTDEDDAAEILVCQAGACRRAGSEAVLLEIEELASSVGGHAVVQPSGCLGNCSQAPNAVVTNGNGEKMFARLCQLSDSAQLVAHACGGEVPNLEDEHLVGRLQRARKIRVRQQVRRLNITSPPPSLPFPTAIHPPFSF